MLKGILKFIGSGAKGVFNIQNVPLIGDFVEEIKSEDGGKGSFRQVNTIRLIRKLARIAIIGLVIYFIIKGDDEKAEKIQEQFKKIDFIQTSKTDPFQPFIGDEGEIYRTVDNGITWIPYKKIEYVR